MPLGPLSPQERAEFRRIAAAQHADAERRGVSFIAVDGRGTVLHKSGGSLVAWKNCAICDERFWFDPFKAGRAGKFCSNRCRQQAHRSRHPRAVVEPTPLLARCQHCGRPIPEQLHDGRDTGRPARFCSATCRARAHRRKRAGLTP